MDIAAGRLAPQFDWSDITNGEHFIQLYETDAFLVEALSGYIGSGLAAGDAGVMVATAAHREALEQRLRSDGFDLPALIAQGRYLSLDAADVLQSFTVNGTLDRERFRRVADGILTRVARGNGNIRVFGEMVVLLWVAGRQDDAIRLEQWWNDMQDVMPFTLCCGYPVKVVAGTALTDAVDKVWSAHTHILPSESYSKLRSSGERLEAIAQLQQQAASLETESAERRQADDRFRFLAESMPQKIFTALPTGEVDYFNQQWTEFTGLSFEQIRDWGWLQFIHPDDVDENIRRWQQSIDTGEPFQYEHRFRDKHGAFRWHLSRAHAMRDDAGDIVMWIGSNTDIDDQKRTEEALRASEERFKTAFAHAATGMALTDLAGQYLQVNDAYCAITGYSEAELLDMNYVTLTHPDDRDLNLELIARMLAGDIPSVVMEKRYLRKDDEAVWVQFSVSVLRATDGTPAAMIAIVEDIGERKRAQDDAARARARLNALFMEAPAAIAVYRGPDHVVELMNPVCRQMLGGRIGLDQALTAAIPELGDSPVRAMLDRVYATGETSTGQEWLVPLDRDQDGVLEDAYFNFVAQPSRDPDGLIEGVVAFAVEVTDQVVARQTVEKLAADLGRQQQWLESLLNLLPVPILLIEPGTARVYFSNRAADEMAGGTFPKAESATEYYQHYYCTDASGNRIPDEGLPGVRAARGERLRGFEMDWHTPGGVRSLLLNSEQLPAAHGHPATVVVAFDDVTRLKEIEAALNQAIRTRDEFLGAASHDLRNPLAVLQGQAQLLRRRSERGVLSPAQMADGLQLIETRSRAMAALIDQLLDVTRLTLGQELQLDRRPVDLVALVGEVVREARQSNEDHHLRVEHSVAELTSSCDRLRLVRVFENLLNNAIKYSPSGGEVLVTVGSEDTPDGEFAVVRVVDQGLGIPAGDVPHIFERFYRAANVTGRIAGTGIGLAGVRQIVEQHGGTVGVDSEEGAGSTFTVCLPLTVPEDESQTRTA